MLVRSFVQRRTAPIGKICSSRVVSFGLCWTLALVAVAAPALAGGAGDLLVAPTRIVLEGRQRTAEVTLVNTGAAAATYRIAFVELRMTDTGGTVEIEPAEARAGEQFAEPLIRYSPRQVTLEPRVAQTVRMQLRLPADLPPGEYRSHLRFRAVPIPAAVAGTVEAAAPFSVELTAIYGVSIPIIVRHGETAATATLAGLALDPPAGAAAASRLRFRILRSGNRSVYGNLTATLFRAGGEPIVVGIANGVAVYTPNALRDGGLDLVLPPGVASIHGRLHLAYTDPEKGNEPIAEADLALP
jgi:hypothetical protein